LAQAFECRIESALRLGAASEPPQRIRGTSQRAHLVAFEACVIRNFSKMMKHVVVDCQRPVRVLAFESFSQGQPSVRQSPSGNLIVRVLMNRTVGDAEGPVKRPYRVFGPSQTGSVIIAENSALGIKNQYIVHDPPLFGVAGARIEKFDRFVNGLERFIEFAAAL